MLVLGLTGNIGCGKSSVSTIFMNHGIDIVDADIVARHIFEDLDLLNKVFSTFGETIKNEDGSLNRKALGNIVFNDDKKLIALNNLTHPKIKENILNEFADIDIGQTLYASNLYYPILSASGDISSPSFFINSVSINGGMKVAPTMLQLLTTDVSLITITKNESD